MRKIFLRWILLALSVIAASAVCHALNLGFEVTFVHTKKVTDLALLLMGVAILSLLNATVGRLIKFLTLPLSCITLGLFSLVVNALVLEMAASLNFGFNVGTAGGFAAFKAAFIASLLISFINGVLGVFLPDDEKED